MELKQRNATQRWRSQKWEISVSIACFVSLEGAAEQDTHTFKAHDCVLCCVSESIGTAKVVEWGES